MRQRLELLAAEPAVQVAARLAGVVERRLACPLERVGGGDADEGAVERAAGERAPDDVVLLVDVKRPGYERDVVKALQEARIVERTIVASYFARAIRAVREREPRRTTGIGYPADRTGLAERDEPTPVDVAALTSMRQVLPLRLARMIRAAQADAVLIHHLAISRPLVARCRALGVPLVAWTVNDRRSLERVLRLDVDAIVSDDPLVFRGLDWPGDKTSRAGVYDSS